MRTVVSSLGSILTLASLAFLPPAAVAWLRETRDVPVFGTHVPLNALVFASCFLGTVIAGQSLKLAGGRLKDLRDIEGYAVVALGWLVVPVVFAAPLLLTDYRAPEDAFFEAMSGVTTTGFSVAANVDDLADSVVFWRSLMQWIGGGGIAVLSVAVLSRLTESGARLMRAELPGGSVTRLKPKIAQTAKSLYGVYVVFTVLVFGAIFASLVLRLDFTAADATWHAINITFATVATGGFVPTSAGLDAYPDEVVRWVIVGGMIIGGTSFTLLYFTVHGEPRRLTRDPEWRFFIALVVGAGAAIALILLFSPMAAWDAAAPPGTTADAYRESVYENLHVDPTEGPLMKGYRAFASGVFHVTSIMTTTGFATANYDAWPEAAKVVFLLLMFTGACAGSTASALKLARTLLLAKVARREILKLVNPNAYVPVRIGGAVVSEDTIRGIIAFFFAYIGLFVVSTIFLAIFGHDIFTSASASAASLGNVGVGLGGAGPFASSAVSIASFTPVEKVWLAFMMWLGRLEIFAAVLLFLPSTYRR